MINRIKNTPKLSQIKGLSLIEVLVTITITSIGLMGLVSLQMQAVRATADSGNRSQAVWVFNDIVNRIHANENVSASYITAGVACTPTPAITCNAYHTGTASVDVPIGGCTGLEQANWDLFEVACGNPRDNSAGIRFLGNAIEFDPADGVIKGYLPEAQLSIACVDAPCVDGDPLNITLTWRSRADSESITGAARTNNSGLLTLTDVITP